MTEKEQEFAQTPRKRSRAHQLGDPRFYCTFPNCTKSFTRKEHLRRHERSHENIKSFTCRICNRAFARSDVLNRHVQQMHLQRRNQQQFTQAQQQRYQCDPQLYTVAKNGSLGLAGAGAAAPAVPGGFALPKSPLPVGEKATEKELAYVDGTTALPLTTDSSALRPLMDIPGSVLTTELVQTERASFFPSSLPLLPIAPNKSTKYILTAHSDMEAEQILLNAFQWVISNCKDQQKVGLGGAFVYTNGSWQANRLIGGKDFTPYRFSSATLPAPFESTPTTTTKEETDIIHTFIKNELHLELSVEFDASLISQWLDVFWNRFASLWPIIHHSTFSVQKAPPALTMSILMFPMRLSENKVIRDLSALIQKQLYPYLIDHPKFGPPSCLWILQSLFLNVVYARMSTTVQQHQHSKPMLAYFIELLQQGFVPYQSTTPDADPETEKWLAWVHNESIKRVAIYTLVFEVQGLILFGYSPILSVAEVSYSLPCSDDKWNSETASNWARVADSESDHLLNLVKGYLTQGALPEKNACQSMIILFYALISMEYTFKKKKPVLLYHTNKRGLDTFFGLFVSVYERWYRDFQMVYLDSGLLSANKTLVKEYLSFYNMYYISSRTDVSSIRCFASTVANDPKQWPTSPQTAFVKAWPKTDNAKCAVLNAISLLELLLSDDFESDLTLCAGLSQPWCVFISTIILWAYGFALDEKCLGFEDQGNLRTHLNVYLMKMRLIMQYNDMEAIHIRSRTVDLINCSIQALQRVPWGLMTEGTLLLQQLVGHQPTEPTFE
ncbi:hypothetical protein SJAG_00163 [Schizosaccharomyces japonicus yFS275]|uniref:C2H2-type domain-containing protein n=1 Tax=Schizosaccharomyces japonicus (strain yFS275 / FY16936) TaxID=402676 RepID=B6JXM3_SCHJY|nr:hypothetical protein SJAG_00163 [Schizosaccharomyces japonicus yFS275]EEB05167.1 hypothetical protein SJAG_00163 [Schizosaccharomyces japonicus yFS275]